MSKYLVTGGVGFIRSCIAEKYLDIYNKTSRVNNQIAKIDRFILKAINNKISKKDLLEY